MPELIILFTWKLPIRILFTLVMKKIKLNSNDPVTVKKERHTYIEYVILHPFLFRWSLIFLSRYNPIAQILCTYIVCLPILNDEESMERDSLLLLLKNEAKLIYMYQTNNLYQSPYLASVCVYRDGESYVLCFRCGR